MTPKPFGEQWLCFHERFFRAQLLEAERLAEKEGERELKSQEMMFAVVKEVAKIFKGQ